MNDFAAGFECVGRFCLTLSGGIAAVLLFVITLLIVISLAGIIFDKVTAIIAKHWERKKHEPRYKLGQVIWEHHRHLEE